MNILEIEQKMLEKKTPIDFVAICITNWHLRGVFAFLNEVYETEDRVLNGFIVIKKHVHTGYLIDPAITKSPPYVNAEFYFLDENRSQFNKRNLFKLNKNRDCRNLYIISSNTPWLAMACHCAGSYERAIKLVVVDEGLSSYFGRLHWLRQQLFIEKNLCNTIVLVGKYLVLDTLKFILGYKEEKFMLLNFRRGICTPNSSVVRHYKNIVPVNEQTFFFDGSSNYAIFLTQPLVEDGLIDIEPLFEFYCRVDTIFKQVGIELYFKTHPREKHLDIYHSYCLNLIEDIHSAEEFVSLVKNKPTFILGLYTTSLVSIKLFYDMETVSLNKLFIDKAVPKETHRILREFNARFKHIVCIPECEEFEIRLTDKAKNAV